MGVNIGKLDLLGRDLSNDPRLYQYVADEIVASMSPLVPASTSSNAQYNPEHFINNMITAAIVNGQIAGCTTSLRGIMAKYENQRHPTDEWMRITAAKTDSCVLLKCFGNSVISNLELLIELGVLTKDHAIDLAIDMHLITMYDKRYGDELVRSKFKNGTCVFERYISIQCIVAGYRLILAPQHAHRFCNQRA